MQCIYKYWILAFRGVNAAANADNKRDKTCNNVREKVKNIRIAEPSERFAPRTNNQTRISPSCVSTCHLRVNNLFGKAIITFILNVISFYVMIERNAISSSLIHTHLHDNPTMSSITIEAAYESDRVVTIPTIPKFIIVTRCSILEINFVTTS